MSPAAGPFSSSGPALSVLLTVHGRTRYLHDALESIERQAAPPSSFEVVVAGTFDDPAVEEELRVRHIDWARVDSEGLGAKVAEGIRRSRAPVLLFLEDDDAFLPGKLETVLARFRAESDLGYYHNSFVPIDAEGRTIPRGFFRERARARIDRRGAVHIPSGRPRRGLAAFAHLFPGYNTSSIAVRREILEPHLDLLARVGLAVDQFLLTAALGSPFSLRVDSSRLTAIRMHGTSASNPETSAADRLRRLGEFSDRNRISWEPLRELARRSGDPNVVRATLGAAAVEEAIRLLRDPTPSRSEAAHHLLDLARTWNSFAVRTFEEVLPIAAGYLCSPTAARAVYRLARGLHD